MFDWFKTFNESVLVSFEIPAGLTYSSNLVYYSTKLQIFEKYLVVAIHDMILYLKLSNMYVTSIKNILGMANLEIDLPSNRYYLI